MKGSAEEELATLMAEVLSLMPKGARLIFRETLNVFSVYPEGGRPADDGRGPTWTAALKDLAAHLRHPR